MAAVDLRVLLACVVVVSLAGHNDGEVLRRRREPDDSSGTSSCSVVNERSETIIQTKQSLAAGAVFLIAPDVASRDDCLSSCCNTPSCTTAVVKWKARILLFVTCVALESDRGQVLLPPHEKFLVSVPNPFPHRLLRAVPIPAHYCTFCTHPTPLPQPWQPSASPVAHSRGG